jgi:hypothetical protein
MYQVLLLCDDQEINIMMAMHRQDIQYHHWACQRRKPAKAAKLHQ